MKNLTAKNCRKLADIYASVPATTHVKMMDGCNCAAGFLGRIKGLPEKEQLLYDEGKKYLYDTLLPGKGSVFEKEDRVRLALLKLGYKTDHFTLTSTHMGANRKKFVEGQDGYTTTGWLARFWRRVASQLEAGK